MSAVAEAVLTPTRASAALAEEPLWYKDAIVYELHVKAFFDANGDGIGDFAGLTSKLDYIQELGVNTIWLLPFYPSPFRDDGYDVADYHNVHQAYGTREDFRRFVREAHRRRLRVITELVINHTSDEHPWFQAARRAPRGSDKRNFYVWSDDPNRYAGTRIIFTDSEKSNWSWDEVAQQYYWHRFFHHQPDLNFDNPRVLQAVIRTLRFWTEMGVDGFRLDAIPYLIEREGTSNENLRETHAVIKQIRAALDAHYTDRVLLAEANMWPEDVSEYFGNGDECHMAYHFPLMPRIYMALAQEDRHPIAEIMAQTPDIPDACQWAVFLRNHDELTLEMVTSKERDYMYSMYAADKRARINLGIRRRLAPLMDNDRERIRLMNSLLLSMPGSPIIYYGDEIGMGDNIYLGDRDGVRTPMQWTSDRNGGFSRADPQRLYLPPIMDPVYGFEAINVEAQLRDPSSTLNWMKRIIAVRKSNQAFGRGRQTFLRPGNRKVLAFLREYGDEAVLCVANVARSAQPVELDLARFRGRVPVEMLGRTAFPPIGELPYLLTLPSHGFFWFRLATDEAVPAWHDERLAPERLEVLVLFDGWSSLFRDRVVPWRIGMAERLRRQLETSVLPRFVEQQRWYGAKGTPIQRVELVDHAMLEHERRQWLLALVTVDSGGGELARYFVPLSLAWEDREEELYRSLAPVTMAKVRQQAEVGVLADALHDPDAALALVESIRRGLDLPTTSGTLRFRPTRAFAELAGSADERREVTRPPGTSSNSVVHFGQRLFLKAYRRIRAGINPELEVGRFLTEEAEFASCVPVAGSIEHVDADGTVSTLALLQAYVANQGDGWTFTLDYLGRVLERDAAAPAAQPVPRAAAAGQEAAAKLDRPAEGPPLDAEGAAGREARAEARTAAAGGASIEATPEAVPAWGDYLALAATLGRRTGELHLALARPTGDPAFGADPVTAADVDAWVLGIRNEAAQTLDMLQQRLPALPEAERASAQALLDDRAGLLAAITAPVASATVKIRQHGDYHLGQVLLAQNDWIIIDFEGEPTRPIEQRRARHSPLRDVASMVRSFSYASAAALERASPEAARRKRSRAVLDAWEHAARAAFLAAYDEAVAGSGLFGATRGATRGASRGTPRGTPTDAPPAGAAVAPRAFLHLFELEKALYELRYELDNRPAWAGIPLRGIARLRAGEADPTAGRL